MQLPGEKVGSRCYPPNTHHYTFALFLFLRASFSGNGGSPPFPDTLREQSPTRAAHAVLCQESEKATAENKRGLELRGSLPAAW